MGNETCEAVQVSRNHSTFKAHNLICQELKKVLDKVCEILPQIEAARPGWSLGIKELCNLNKNVKKADLLLQHCAECGKFYLSITGEAILLRSEGIRNAFNESLTRIQFMVPEVLAAQIADVVNHVGNPKFLLDHKEKEAGEAILELLRRKDSTVESEFEAFHLAVKKLNLTSPKAILIERRCIKKLLSKIEGKDPKKERILNFFLCLFEKYGKKIRQSIDDMKENLQFQCENFTLSAAEEAESSSKNGEADKISFAPEEFICPISSKIMFDPVIIGSGKSYERICIEKWFREGNHTCPKTKKKLSNLSIVSNSCLKDRISIWCTKHSVSQEDSCLDPHASESVSWDPSNCNSIQSLENVSAHLLDRGNGDFTLQCGNLNTSFKSSDSSCCSVHDHDQIFCWSDDYQEVKSFSSFSVEIYMKFFDELCELPLDEQGRAMREMKYILEIDEDSWHAMVLNGFTEALLGFFNMALDSSDIHAQRIAAEIFLAFLSYRRVEVQTFNDAAFQLVASLLDSDATMEALAIARILSINPEFIPKAVGDSRILISLVKLMVSENMEIAEMALQILCNMSSHDAVKFFFLHSESTAKLAPLITKERVSGLCIKLLQNLCNFEGAATIISRTSGILSSLVELLDANRLEEQEGTVFVLHAVCVFSSKNCLHVLREGIIPALVNISVTGTPMGKEYSLKLLQVLRDLRNNDRGTEPECLSRKLKPESEDFNTKSQCEKGRQTSRLSSIFFGRKTRLLSKQTLALS